MTMSVKMLADIATHAQAMADEAQAMAAAIQIMVDDCAEQLAGKKTEKAEKNAEKTETKAGSEAAGTPAGAKADPEWLEDAQKNIVPPEAEPGKKLTIAEVRAYVAERTRPENRAQIRAILKGFGVAKLTELPEDKYEALMKEVAKL